MQKRDTERFLSKNILEELKHDLAIQGARAPMAMVLTMKNKQVHGEGFQLPVLFQG